MTELLHRSAAFQPQSFNPETRTVSVISSSGAPVRRFDFDGPYEERLDLAPEAVDLSELIGGPVLNSHNRFDVNSILGVVQSAQVDGQRGTATIRFSERAASIMADVRDGIIKCVSVGYVINQKRVDKDPTNGTRIITATRWTPKEISFVAIPADPAAKVRGGTMDKEQNQATEQARRPESSKTALITLNALHLLIGGDQYSHVGRGTQAIVAIVAIGNRARCTMSGMRYQTGQARFRPAAKDQCRADRNALGT